MEWIKIKAAVNGGDIEKISEIFEKAGISSLEIEDNEEFLEILEQTKAGWNFIDEALYEEKSKARSVAGYVPNTPAGKKIFEKIKNKTGGSDLTVSIINEENWAENWKKYFKPIPTGKNILICPVWEKIPKKYKSRKIFKVDPGMCFGTGTHESTRLCIAEMENYVKPGDVVLDLGCGSGILSLTALILGAKYATAADIDENSAKITSENAKINGIAPELYKVYTGNLLTDKKLRGKISEQKYEIIFMNIVPDVIIPLLPFAGELLKNKGALILSGIIGKYLPDIEKSLNLNGLKIIGISSENDWQCVVAGK